MNAIIGRVSNKRRVDRKVSALCSTSSLHYVYAQSKHVYIEYTETLTMSCEIIKTRGASIPKSSHMVSIAGKSSGSNATASITDVAKPLARSARVIRYSRLTFFAK